MSWTDQWANKNQRLSTVHGYLRRAVKAPDGNRYDVVGIAGHIALWFILGALLWASAPGNTNPVRTAEDQGHGPIDKLWRGDGSDQVPG